MKSESDNSAGRRPPTIELAATEVATSADEPAAGAAQSAEPRPAEEAPAGSNASSPSGSNPQTTSASSGRLKSQVAGALIGAVIMAAALAALWFTDLIPARDGTASHTLASNTSASAPPSTTPPPNQPANQTPDLRARLDKIERAIEAQRNEPAVGGRIAGVEAQAKSLGDGIAALQRRVDEIAASGQSAAKQADTALSAAEAARSASEATNKMEVQRSDFDALASRIMALESAVKGLAAATVPVDRAARLTIAAESLRATVERGAPYQAELASLRALGVDEKATAPLEPFAANGVPSAVP
ncbi:MAG TPA: hypothetical protein VGV62_09345, partial [Xanthobacteraceae bacterium]|nr:hypothetical protein [Xanthobacteraceae bacterium]